jgi:hypothetical protein
LLSSDSREHWEHNETVHQLFRDFKIACDSVRRELFYNIFAEFGITMKLVRPIKMCLNETYSKVRTDEHISDNFLVQIGLEQGDSLPPLLFNVVFKRIIRKVQENSWD